MSTNCTATVHILVELKGELVNLYIKLFETGHIYAK